MSVRDARGGGGHLGGFSRSLQRLVSCCVTFNWPGCGRNGAVLLVMLRLLRASPRLSLVGWRYRPGLWSLGVQCGWSSDSRPPCCLVTHSANSASAWYREGCCWVRASRGDGVRGACLFSVSSLMTWPPVLVCVSPCWEPSCPCACSATLALSFVQCEGCLRCCGGFRA